ncbi:hypothetical protein, partial [Thermococcus sp.]|uniref:hypothetical protein n=1 Tax=Thermococcus sp. TaxID=35749 RepID=UPI00261AE95F
SVYNQKVGRRELPVEMKKRSGGVVSATEIVERRKELSKPKNIYQYLGEVPEWLSRALEDPRELSAMLWYGVERYLKEKAKTHSDASMYADFLKKWLGENIIGEYIDRKKRAPLTFAEAMALYAVEQAGGALVEGGIHEVYRKVASLIRAWLKRNAKAGEPYSTAVLAFLRKHRKICHKADYNHFTVQVKFEDELGENEKGWLCEPTMFYLVAVVPATVLKSLGYEPEFPWPFNEIYEKFVAELRKELR